MDKQKTSKPLYFLIVLFSLGFLILQFELHKHVPLRLPQSKRNLEEHYPERNYLEIKNKVNPPLGVYSSLKHSSTSMRALQAEIHLKHVYAGPHPPLPSACPLGKYRGPAAGIGQAHAAFKFSNDMGCIPCPRGVYGETTGLTTAACTLPCPKGRYGHKPGAITKDDCLLCPPGTYGLSLGMTNADCSGSCPLGKYSDQWGMTSSIYCKPCHQAYRGWQCRNLWKTIELPDMKPNLG